MATGGPAGAGAATAAGDLAAVFTQMAHLLEAQQQAQKALLKQLMRPRDGEFLMETLFKTLTEFAYARRCLRQVVCRTRGGVH